MSYKDLQKARRTVEMMRQPKFANDVQTLDQLLEQGGCKHPYNGSAVKVLEGHALVNGARGGVAVRAKGGPFYHITFASKLTSDPALQWKPRIIAYKPLEDILTFLRGRAYLDWTPLTLVARGAIGGLRQFTWWSSEGIDEEDLLRDVHRRGLPNDWLGLGQLIILRWMPRGPLNGEARIPTPVDGYFSPVFNAVLEGDPRGCGFALDIQNPSDLKEGADEYAVTPIPVEEISWKLMELKRNRQQRVLTSDLQRALIEFHRNCANVS
jgi:hypothetical protein